MSNLAVPFLESAAAGAGCKLNTYEAGTTTPLATYSDKGRTSANANPVVADANGVFGPIYCTPDTGYKFVLTDADDVTIKTIDDYYAAELSDGASVARIKQIAASPIDYPEAGVAAVGDGVADESAQVQNAIDASTGTVDLCGLTFRCDSALTLKTGLTLKNGTLDFSNCTETAFITATGSLGTTNNLTNDSARGDEVIDVSDGSGFAAGDWMLIITEDDWHSKDTAEILQVFAVSANAITTTPVENDYMVTDFATVREITMVSRVRLENLNIVASVSNGTRAVDLKYCQDVVVRDCTFTDFPTNAIRALCCTRLRVLNSTFERRAQGAGYIAIQVGAVTRNTVIDGCEFRQCIQCVDGISTDYEPILDITVRNCMAHRADTLCEVDTVQGLVVVGNNFIGDNGVGSTAIWATSTINYLIADNSIRNAGGDAIRVDTTSVGFTGGQPWSSIIRDNRIWNPGSAGIDVSGNSPTLEGLLVSGNQISDCGIAYPAINISGSNFAKVIGNHIDSELQPAVGIRIAGTSGVVVSGNTIKEPLDGIKILTGTAMSDLTINGNTIENPTGSGIEIVATAGALERVVVSNNIVTDLGYATACLWLECTGSSTISDVVVSGNNFERVNDTGDNIHLLGAAAGSITNVCIVGNVLRRGDYGVGEATDANSTNLMVQANVFISMNTGATEGTVTTAANLSV